MISRDVHQLLRNKQEFYEMNAHFCSATITIFNTKFNNLVELYRKASLMSKLKKNKKTIYSANIQTKIVEKFGPTRCIIEMHFMLKF